MKKIDIKLSSWLDDKVVPKQQSFEDHEFGLYIKNVIPPIYESYCKVFNPFIDITNQQANKSWKSMAEKCNIYFHNEISPLSYIKKIEQVEWQNHWKFPVEGALRKHDFLVILEVLKYFTLTGNVFIYQKAPHTIFKDDLIEDLVFANLNEVTDYFNEDFKGFLYDENKTWIVYADADLMFTLIGGKTDLIESLKQADLEVVECFSETRIDDFSDKINIFN